MRVEPAEHQVGVGHGRLPAAATVARRTGLGAGASRSHPKRAAVVQPGDASAPGPDCVNVEHRQPHRQAAHRPLRRAAGASAANQRDVAAGAAHVEGDRIRSPHARHRRDPAGRPGQKQPGRMRRHLRHRRQPAAGLHQRGFRQAAAAGRRSQRAQVAAHHRAKRLDQSDSVADQRVRDDRCGLTKQSILADRITREASEVHAGSDRDLVSLSVDFMERADGSEVDDHLACRRTIASRVYARDQHRALTMFCDRFEDLLDGLRCLDRVHKK